MDIPGTPLIKNNYHYYMRSAKKRQLPIENFTSFLF